LILYIEIESDVSLTLLRIPHKCIRYYDVQRVNDIQGKNIGSDHIDITQRKNKVYQARWRLA